MTKVTPTSRRKANHIRINLEEDVQSGLTSGLERFRFEHNAVPELNLNQVDTSLEVLGKRLEAPILISSMTGGTTRARDINLALAEGAQWKRVAMGLGSQRAAIEDPQIEDTYRVRHVAPDILLFANLGAVQLNYGYGIDQCKRAVDMIEADALILHFNALQEALQPEGDVDFSGLLPEIERVCRALEVPVIAKEVGWGISAQAATRLIDAGVTGIDVAGAGGTSWSQVEMHRAESPERAQLARAFVKWGIPTADCILQIRPRFPDILLFASGGLRDGIDIAKSIALGADLGGMAGPFLAAAEETAEKVAETIDLIATEIRICMFAAGCAGLDQLHQVELMRAP